MLTTQFVKIGGRVFNVNAVTHASFEQCQKPGCGEWNDYYGNYRWQKLPGGDHSALGDCKATLEVIRRMAAA